MCCIFKNTFINAIIQLANCMIWKKDLEQVYQVAANEEEQKIRIAL